MDNEQTELVEDIKAEEADKPEAAEPQVEESIEELRQRLAAAEAREAKTRAESIERRQRLAKEKSEKSSLLERLEALEEEARIAKLDAARANALSKYGLPQDAIAILGEDAAEVDAKASQLAALLKSVDEVRDSGSGSRLSLQGREAVGGRNPLEHQDATDIKSLVAKYSRA